MNSDIKLVLSNNQTEKFTQFHRDLQADEKLYEYTGYASLLFIFQKGSVDFITLHNGYHARDYKAAYLTSYLHSLELASAAALVLDANAVRYVDRQLENAVSASKLTEYARLAVAGVTIPFTYAGTARALLEGLEKGLLAVSFPLILKRADADRGMDNYKIASEARLQEVLRTHSARSLWVVQEFIPNDGFYRLTFYQGTLSSVVFRAAHERPDHNDEKTHLNKPKGGVNAFLVEEASLPEALIDEARHSCQAMKREFAGVDALLDTATGTPYILEVNYNPQLVTINTFEEERRRDFLEAMKRL